MRSLRKRELIDAFKRGQRTGTYWGIRTDISAYGVPSLPCPLGATTALAKVSTRLASLEAGMQEKLINWGYAVTDAALRAHFAHALPDDTRVGTFPYPRNQV